MSTTDYAKGKVKKLAGNFFSKLAESFESEKTASTATPNIPPKPPAKPPPITGVVHPAFTGQDISSTFQNLSVSGQGSTPTPASYTPFVGGFNPTYTGLSNAVSPLGTPSFELGPSNQFTPTSDLSQPVAMPSPHASGSQSLTMQMALQQMGNENNLLPSRPHSNPIATSVQLDGPSKPLPKKPISSPSTPTKSKEELETSSRLSLSTLSKPGQVQCAGVTKAGKRCTRMVKASLANASDSSEDDDEHNSSLKFCHQHTKEVLGNSGYYSRKNGEWVEFEDWIPGYLQAETQVALRVEMEKTHSQSDVPGYIYTFEIRESGEVESIKLKVGRAVNLVKRIDQWGKQCGTKEQVLRGFHPAVLESDETGKGVSLLKGRVQAGEKAPWCHRLERLIHLELGDLACSCVYLDPAWPDVDLANAAVVTDKLKGGANSEQPCSDCGSIHKEIFEFRRWRQGKYKGKEWESLVKPVVERWGKFVELYV